MVYLNFSAPFLNRARGRSTGYPTSKPLLILATFLILTPTTRAFDGSNFSNNLISDLAPLLALFGEEVAKQFLSHTTSWLECLIFACNPISIITGATSAIRVGGSRWLRAVIGRAGEAEANAELELMSSTSSDVCELWNGVGIVRVVGSPAIVELIYRKRKIDAGDSGLLHELNDTPDVYTLDAAKEHGIFKVTSEISQKRTDAGESKSAAGLRSSFAAFEKIESQTHPPPNIFRNTASVTGNKLELIVVAVIGVISQAAVLVYDAIMSYHWNWGRSPSVAFPLTCIGTLGMVIGMFICAMVIDAKTHEEQWEVVEQTGSEPFRVVWLQKGQLVGDQAFGSFAIHAPLGQRVITKSWKSPKDSTRLEFWSLWGSGLAIFGFVFQFVGLRDMHWTAALAQLIATCFMTFLRVVVRRHLSALPKVDPLPEGFELDFMAQEITNCGEWRVLTIAGLDHPGDQEEISEVSVFADHTLQTRIRLSELTAWHTQCSEIADQVTRTIHDVMNHLFEAGSGVSLAAHVSNDQEFIWKLPVTVTRTQALGEEKGNIYLKLRREFSDNRWTPWRLEKGELEAVISLWMAHFRNSGVSNLWILDSHHIFSTSAYDWWIYRGTASIRIQNVGDVCRTNFASPNRILNLTSKALPEDLNTHVFPSGQELLGVVTRSSLQKMCGQYLAGVFLSRVIDIIEDLGGKTDVVPGVGRSSYTLANKNIRKIAEIVQRHGLGTAEDSYRLVVAPLSQANKLKDPLDDLDALRRIISMHQDNPTSEQFLAAHRHLVDYCTAKAELLSEKDNWKAAREAFTQLIEVSRELLGTYHPLTMEAAKAMKDFAMKFVDSHSDTDISKPVPHKKEAFLLHSAAKRGDIRGVFERLEGDGYGVDTWNAESRTPLGIVLEHGHQNLARLLLFYGADIGEAISIEDIGKPRDPKQQQVVNILLLNWGDLTLLNKAAAEGQNNIVKILLAGKRIDVSGKDEEGWTALHHAAKNGRQTTIKLLLNEHGAAPGAKDLDGQSALHVAVRNSQKSVIKTLVEGGVNVNAHNAKGQTALHTAATDGLDDIVQELVNHGADVNSEDNTKLSVLHAAVTNLHEEIARYLIENGADLSARNKDGYTALHCACEHDKCVGIIEFLVEKGSSLSAKDKWARAPLAIAATSGSEAILRLLLSKGADVNTGDNCGRSLLDIASRTKFVGVAELLITNGVDLENKDGFGRMALHYAALEGCEDVVKLLLANRVEIDAADIDGWTPLHYAYKNKRASIVKMLLDGGASSSIMDRKGRTALYYSKSGGEAANSWSRAPVG